MHAVASCQDLNTRISHLRLEIHAKPARGSKIGIWWDQESPDLASEGIKVSRPTNPRQSKTDWRIPPNSRSDSESKATNGAYRLRPVTGLNGRRLYRLHAEDGLFRCPRLMRCNHIANGIGASPCQSAPFATRTLRTLIGLKLWFRRQDQLLPQDDMSCRSGYTSRLFRSPAYLLYDSGMRSVFVICRLCLASYGPPWSSKASLAVAGPVNDMQIDNHQGIGGDRTWPHRPCVAVLLPRAARGALSACCRWLRDLVINANLLNLYTRCSIYNI